MINLSVENFMSPLNVSEMLSLLRKYGVCVVPDFLSNNMATSLESQCKSFLQKKEDTPFFYIHRHPVNEKGSVARLYLHKDKANSLSNFSSVFDVSELKSLAEQFFDSKTVLYNYEIFITNEFFSPQSILPWHFDRVQSLKFFIPLMDMDETNGAFEYCPGSHLLGRLRADRDLVAGKLIEEIANDIAPESIPFKLTLNTKKGDLIIFDPDGYHRGGFVQGSKERLVIRSHCHSLGVKFFGSPRFMSKRWVARLIFKSLSPLMEALGRDFSDYEKQLVKVRSGVQRC